MSILSLVDNVLRLSLPSLSLSCLTLSSPCHTFLCELAVSFPNGLWRSVDLSRVLRSSNSLSQCCCAESSALQTLLLQSAVSFLAACCSLRCRPSSPHLVLQSIFAASFVSSALAFDITIFVTLLRSSSQSSPSAVPPLALLFLPCLHPTASMAQLYNPASDPLATCMIQLSSAACTPVNLRLARSSQPSWQTPALRHVSFGPLIHCAEQPCSLPHQCYQQ